MIGKRRWTVRMLLVGVNLSILVVPLSVLVLAKVFEAYLLRQTERQLMAESVVIGEAWREELLVALDADTDSSFRPPDRADALFAPYRAQISLGFEVLPEAGNPPSEVKVIRSHFGDTFAVGPFEEFLKRGQVFNLSGARILDREGYVVASTGQDRGEFLGALEEVVPAIHQGKYASVVRKRETSGPSPSISSIERRGALRVFTAMPIFVNGEVAGVVRMSRTAASPIEIAWAHRGKVALTAALVLLFTPLISYMFSHAISKPMRDLTRAAESMAAGDRDERFEPGPAAPREVVILSDALNRMTKQLNAKSDFILEFASNVSHELKAPVTGLTGAIELLEDEWEEMPAEQRQRFLRNMAGDAARMERLAADLLRLARIEGAVAPDETIALGEFIIELAERYGEAVHSEVELPGPTLSIPRDHLETALHNLLDNAVRHGKGEPVVVRAAAEQGRTVISVRDRGDGISAGNRSRIFERFFTTERERGGTGLGLAIVRAIADARGGRVDFTTGNDGTEFRLVL